VNSFKETISEAVVRVQEGMSDPLEIYAYLKDLEKHLKISIDNVKEHALTEAEKFEDKTFEHLGLNFELRNGKSTYKFDHIDLWKDKKAELKRLEDIAKASLKNGSVAIDSDTGEEIPPAKVSFSKDSLIVKL
jgi:hypothetical protein